MKVFLKIIFILLFLYILVCGALYFYQEKVIFFPQQLSKDHKFNFKHSFEEVFIKVDDETNIHGLIFRADSSKGLIFYLHGNGGSVDGWGGVAELYLSSNYDVFILDYRGYGKSEGVIKSQQQLYDDVQQAYNEMLKHYKEDQIVVLGYSIGTGPAAKLASTNNPKLLILQAPYYNTTDMMRNLYPFIPPFLLKYKFETNDYLKDCKMPVVIFHGDQDEVIYYGSSLKLKEHFKSSDTLITLKGEGHNGMTDNREYREAIKRILR